MDTVLQIVLGHAGDPVKPGLYRNVADRYSRATWVAVGPATTVHVELPADDPVLGDFLEASGLLKAAMVVRGHAET